MKLCLEQILISVSRKRDILRGIVVSVGSFALEEPWVKCKIYNAAPLLSFLLCLIYCVVSSGLLVPQTVNDKQKFTLN